MECARCGAPGEYTKLHDVISGEGIVKICDRCLSEERIPVINKPTETQLQNVHKSESLYKRLSSVAGIDPVQHRQNVQEFQKMDVRNKQDVTLRDLVDQKYDNLSKKPSAIKKRDDLVDNFHWIIMRGRRAKKITVTQLAQQIKEPEKVIKLAEQGKIPEGDYILIQKLEDALGVRLLRQEVADELERQKKQLGFDKHSTENLTISDLQEMREKEGGAVPGVQKEPYWRRLMGKFFSEKEDVPMEEIEEVMHQDKERKEFEEGVDTLEFEGNAKEVEINDTGMEMYEEFDSEDKKEDEKNPGEKKDLSQKEIDDLIFGRG